MDYDPITLAQKGVIIEEARTNFFNNSNLWIGFSLRSIVTMTNDFSIFASGQVAKITDSGAGTPVVNHELYIEKWCTHFHLLCKKRHK